MSHRLRALVACLAVLALGAAAVPTIARADDGLVITSQTRYEVMPDEGRIVVSVDLSVTNVVPDTPTERAYYTGVTLPVPADASEVTATSAGVPLPITISPADESTAEVDVTFARGVFFRETYPLSLRFVITDAGGDPQRETWVRSSFVAFPISTLGTANAAGAGVEVILPGSFEPSVQYADLEIQRGQAETRLVASPVPDPSTFFAYVVAERDVVRTRDEIEVRFAERSATVTLRAWPDDPDWSARQADILSRGLPLLEAEIGLPYPINGKLSVSEHAFRHLGDYAGWFIEGRNTIEMRFDADVFTTLHEAAHVWLNSALSGDRWLLEGFASHYAEVVGMAMGEELALDELTDATEGRTFPLVDWGRPIEESPERETYGYAASLAVAREIAATVDPDALRRVWQAAADQRPAYAIHDDERRLRGDPRPEEWQRMLDLFENQSGASLADLWRLWVLDDGRAARLGERATARERYAATRDAAGDWELPAFVRRAMEGWDFEAATVELAALEAVLDRGEALAARAEALRLESTDRLQVAFERSGAAAANEVAEAQQRALDAIARATERLAAEPSFVEQLGLAGEADPAGGLAAARSAYESARNADAEAGAAGAVEGRDAAADRGRARIAAAGGGLLVADLVILGALVARRRGARRPVAAA